MNEEEKAFQKQLQEDGIDVEGMPTGEEETTEETPKEQPKEVEETTEEEVDEEPESTLSEEQPKKKRSIYQEYKDKKSELKSERELREKAEAELEDLRAKLAERSTATTPQEATQETVDELEAFAQEAGADPAFVKRLSDLIQKRVQPKEVDTSIQEGIAEFKEWQKTQSALADAQQFETEFKQSLPAIKELYPSASEQELEAIKSKIDEYAHTERYHDKEIDYIVFKEKASLSKLVSPKKRGMESKGTYDSPETETEFDPNADISKMTPKQQEEWEKQYNKMVKHSENLSKGANGGTIFI